MLLASVLETDGYVVGSNNGSSGFLAYSDGQWHHAGWTNVRAFGVDVEPDTGAILLACGNGLLRSPDNGKSWRVETDWRITEVLDVLPATPTRPTFLATAFGIRRGPSGWEPLDRGLSSKYVCRLADVGGGRVLAATESGAALFLPDLDRWLLVGPSVAARSLAVSNHDAAPGLWLMGAERGGVLTSRDGGTTWHRDWLGADSIYAVAIDTTDGTDGTRLAAGGFSGVLWLSDDAGESWRMAGRPTTGEPGDGIHALAFAPLDDTGTGTTLLCGCGKSGLLTLDPETGATRSRALDKSFVSRIVLR